LGNFVAYAFLLMVLVFQVLQIQGQRLLRWFVLAVVVLVWVVHPGAEAMALSILALMLLPVWQRERPNMRRGVAALLVAVAVMVVAETAAVRLLRENLATEFLDDVTRTKEEDHLRVVRLQEALHHVPELAPFGRVTLAPFLADLCQLNGVAEFGLFLLNADNEVISQVTENVRLQDFPYDLVPENRLEYLSDALGHDPYFLFQRWFEHPFPFRLVYISRSSPATQSQLLGPFSPDRRLRTNHPWLWFPHDFAEFDLEGNLLRSSSRPLTLTERERQGLRRFLAFFPREWGKIEFICRTGDRQYKWRFLLPSLGLKSTRVLQLALIFFLFLKAFDVHTRTRRHRLKDRWQRSYKMKLVALSTLSSLFLALVLGSLGLTFLSRRQHLDEQQLLRDRLEVARKALHELPLHPDQWQRQAFFRDLFWVDAGALVWSSRSDLATSGLLPERLPLPVYTSLITGELPMWIGPASSMAGVTWAFPASLDQSLIVALMPARGARYPTAMVGAYLFKARSPLRETYRNQIEVLISAFVLFMGLVVLVAAWFANALLRPVRALTRNTIRFQRGLPLSELNVQGRDELAYLIRAFERMFSALTQASQERDRQLTLLQNTLKTLRSGLLGMDAQGRVRLSNERVALILSLDSTQTWDNWQEFQEKIPALGPLPEDDESESSRVVRLDLGEHSLRQVLVRLSTLIASREDDIRYLVVFDDISAEVRATQFQAWQEMARRVAHEIKNPLTPIRLELDYVEQIISRHPESLPDAFLEAKEAIEKQVEALHRTAVDFGDYARPLAPRKSSVELISFLRSLMGSYAKHAWLEVVLPEGPPFWLTADETLLNKALMNLVVNAVQAMKGQLDSKRLAQGRLVWRLNRSDPVQLTLEDNGPGITPALKDAIFEAYFTTKDRGTGLGLANAKRALAAQGFLLSLDEGFVKGARFVIALGSGMKGEPVQEVSEN
jgi:signal transduction histidine kinase